jgi:D-alanyl-D-alanine carboxypeptidase
MSRLRLLRRTAGAWRVAPGPATPELRVAVDEAGLTEAVALALARVQPPGAQLVVRRRGRVLFAATAGPVAPDDRFVLASTGKLATACVVMRLAEQGVLDLDEPVVGRLPALPHAPTLTPRLLLAHRSGLRDYTLGRPPPGYPWTRAEVLERIVRREPERAPGRRFAYRNANYVVLAELAERASGERFGALVERLIARPLGLPGFSCTGDVVAPHVRALGRTIDLLMVTRGRIPTHAFGEIWGDGPVASSAHDLARFTEALFGGELVAPETLRAMVRRTSRFGRGYGLGVMLSRTPQGAAAGHDGVYFGWTASASIDDATATTVAVVADVVAPSIPAARLATAVRDAIRVP